MDFNWEDTNAIIARTQNYAIGLSQDANDLNVTVTTALPPTNPPTVTVVVSYKFRTASPILWLVSGSNEYELKTQSTMVLEFLEDLN